MSRPFNRVRKIEKKENIQGANENRKDSEERNNNSRDRPKPPLFQPQKKKINIINPDALKNNQDNHPQPEPKISLGSKPNLFKGKRQANKLLIPNREGTNPQTAHNPQAQAPRPTPQVPRKKGNFDFRSRRDRQEIVIQDEEQSMRMQQQESRQFNVQDSNNLLRKPDLKLKKLTPRRQYTERRQIDEQSGSYSRSGQNPSFLPGDDPLPFDIKYRQIDVEAKVEISEGRIDKQKKRTHQLGPLLNLQMDLYQQTLSIGNITPYEIYINKIKGGFLKNSLDQSFDEKSTNSCQTQSLQFADFTNQCPQDYSVDVNKIQSIDVDHLFDNFILKIAPVIEELIQPTDTITDPPIFLLAFRPSFKAFFKCPYPIFIYRSEEFSLDLIVVGQKLYIAQGEIQSVLVIGKSIVAGLKNGALILWNGDNNKNCKLYHQIKQFTNTTNFELPSFCNHYLQKYSPYASQFSIVSLIHEGGSDFVSLDHCGKIVRWNIEDEQNGSQSLKGNSVTQLRHVLRRPALKAYKIKKRSESYYITTSMGLIVLKNSEIIQRLDTQNQEVIDYQMPKRFPLVLTITSNTLKIYNELYSQPLLSMNFQLNGEKLTQIIIPQLEHDNRQIMILAVLYVTDSAGHIFEIKLLENQYEYVRKLNEDEQGGRRDKNVIFKGVNRAGDMLQTLKLMRDLKMSKMAVKMDVNMEKTVPNLKSIIEHNRQFMALLEEQSAMMA